MNTAFDVLRHLYADFCNYRLGLEMMNIWMKNWRTLTYLAKGFVSAYLSNYQYCVAIAYSN